MCRVLNVSRSGYYAWRKRPVSEQKMANQQLMAEIRRIHEESNETYGSPRVYEELRAQGIQCSENRAARLMRSHGIRAKQVRRHKVTTKGNPNHTKAPNLLQQVFTAEAANEVWCSDISYIWTREGWLYLAVVLDLFSRRIVA
jgi:transposase InsO family protein